jgi:hypothetical protein
LVERQFATPLGVRRRLRALLIVTGTDIEVIGQPIQTEVIPILKSRGAAHGLRADYGELLKISAMAVADCHQSLIAE